MFFLYFILIRHSIFNDLDYEWELEFSTARIRDTYAIMFYIIKYTFLIIKKTSLNIGDYFSQESWMK